MKNLRFIVVIGALMLLGLLASRVVAQKPLLPMQNTMAPTPVSQDLNSPEGRNESAATVSSSISFQGRLSDPNTGIPLNGTYDLEFIFWSASSGGSQVSPATTRNAQTITDGLYNTQLAVTPYYVDGRELWLRIRVRETGAGSWETLTPRIQVLPTAYAMSVRPAARVVGSTDRPNAIVMATNTSSGWGLRGESRDPTGYGVYGYNASASSSAYGGGIIGVTQTDGYGVRGEAPASGDFAYGGYFTGRTGVRTYGKGTESGTDYGGYFVAERRGIYATSLNSYYAGYFNGDIYVDGSVFPLSGTRTLAVNAGAESLEAGDVVAISGIANALEDDGEPMLAVRKASGVADIAVVGVVAEGMLVQEVERSENLPGQKSADVEPFAGTIPPGGYLTIVSHGLAPAVKVAVPSTAAADFELRVGELLTLGAVPGTVQKPEVQSVDGDSANVEGTILGKVAGPFDPQTGTVPVFVILQ